VQLGDAYSNHRALGAKMCHIRFIARFKNSNFLAVGLFRTFIAVNRKSPVTELNDSH